MQSLRISTWPSRWAYRVLWSIEQSGHPSSISHSSPPSSHSYSAWNSPPARPTKEGIFWEVAMIWSRSRWSCDVVQSLSERRRTLEEEDTNLMCPSRQWSQIHPPSTLGSAKIGWNESLYPARDGDYSQAKSWRLIRRSPFILCLMTAR